MTELQHITKHRPLLPIDWHYIRNVIVRTLFFSDDVKVRWLIAFSSLGWAMELWFKPDFFERPLFSFMGEFLPAWIWAVVFCFHGVGAIWRIIERRPRKNWALVINGVGVAVWVAATVCQDLSGGIFVPTSTLESFACVFLFMTFVSTGFSEKSTTV